MAHLVFIDDAYGDLIEVHVYCSDFCAQTDDAYDGWNGCNDVEFEQYCEACGKSIPGVPW